MHIFFYQGGLHKAVIDQDKQTTPSPPRDRGAQKREGLQNLSPLKIKAPTRGGLGPLKSRRSRHRGAAVGTFSQRATQQHEGEFEKRQNDLTDGRSSLFARLQHRCSFGNENEKGIGVGARKETLMSWRWTECQYHKFTLDEYPPEPMG